MNNHPSGLGLAGVSKRFGATHALTDGDLHLRPGEIHTLLGENGSGKSTLVKIMGGIHRPDAGTVTLDGVPVASRSPRAAMDLGVATVFQEVLTAGSQSVLENVWLGSHGTFRRALPRAEQRSIARDVLTRIAGEIPLDLPAGQLSLSERQSLCIARALVRKPKVLILDESTASLDVSSRDRLFIEMRRLAAEGTAILFISHRMDEVAEISDRVTVLRPGRTSPLWSVPNCPSNGSIADMDNLGHDATRRQPHEPGKGVLQGSAIALAPESSPIDFELRAGEIVGLAGLEGHGQDQFIKRLAGVTAGPGRVERLLAEGPAGLTERNGDALGVAYLPRERRGESLFESMSIRENFALPTLGMHRRGGLLNTGSIAKRFEAFAHLLSLRFGAADDAISTLSGGNQQKVLLARRIATTPRSCCSTTPPRGGHWNQAGDLRDPASAQLHRHEHRGPLQRGRRTRGLADRVLSLSRLTEQSLPKSPTRGYPPSRSSPHTSVRNQRCTHEPCPNPLPALALRLCLAARLGAAGAEPCHFPVLPFPRAPARHPGHAGAVRPGGVCLHALSPGWRHRHLCRPPGNVHQLLLRRRADSRGPGNWQLAAPIILAVAAGVGALNGILVAVVRLHPVVATTGMLFLLVGLSLTISQNPVAAPNNWTEVFAGGIGFVPGALITIGVAGIIWFALRRTAFVSNLLAAGESDVSAYGSGVNIKVVSILAYTLGGLFAGIAGIALTAIVQSSQSSLATTYALLGLAAAVLGGTSLAGGRGGLLGALFGALSIYLLQQLLTASGVAPSLIQFAYGAVLVVGVVLGATLLPPA